MSRAIRKTECAFPGPESNGLAIEECADQLLRQEALIPEKSGLKPALELSQLAELLQHIRIPVIGRQSLPFQEIPTLHTDQPANAWDATPYLLAGSQAQLYEKQKDSIVGIQGPIGALESGSGTGFIVDRHGGVVTANHVVDGMKAITVITADGIKHSAHLVNSRRTADVAEIRIDGDIATKPVELASNTGALKQGDDLTVIGHPQGWPRLFLSPGKYSDRETIGDLGVGGRNGRNPEQTMLDVDGHIEPGDSGSPAFDAYGRVVGLAAIGEKETKYDLVPVSDVWSLLNTQQRLEQKNKPDLLTDMPVAPHIGLGTMVLGVASAALISTLAYEKMPLGAMMMSGAALGVHYFGQDFRFLKEAMAHGSTREKIDASIDVGSDALILGGSLVVGTNKPGIGAAIALTGTLTRLGNNLAAYRRYF